MAPKWRSSSRFVAEMILYDVVALVGAYRTVVRVRAYDVPHALSQVQRELGTDEVIWISCARV